MSLHVEQLISSSIVSFDQTCYGLAAQEQMLMEQLVAWAAVAA